MSIQNHLESTKQAKVSLLQQNIASKSELLKTIAEVLRLRMGEIIAENAKDLALMHVGDAKYDRLLLTEERILNLASAVEDVSNLPDPTMVTLSSKVLDNGLRIEKKTVALGVVAVIYEARPNVTIDVAALCIQSGNVCLLRGSSDAWHTNLYLVSLIQDALIASGMNPYIVQLLPTDRELMLDLLTATSYVDIIIPRGSQGLIDYVRTHATVPVIETGAGVCHTYVDKTADIEKAARIIANAKISRPSVCNALDTILVDEEVADELVYALKPYFEEANVEVFADINILEAFRNLDFKHVQLAEESDFGREFLSLKCSIKAVYSLDEALEHIANYSSKHSECIVSTDEKAIQAFMHIVDAAAVYANASTRFTDGGEFGLGAEIGISTQKLHARGPFALEKLVTEKWFVVGDGQIR